MACLITASAAIVFFYRDVLPTLAPALDRSELPPYCSVLARPGFVRAACYPPRHLPGRAAPASAVLLRQNGGGGLSPPSNNARFTAHDITSTDITGGDPDGMAARTSVRKAGPAVGTSTRSEHKHLSAPS